MEAESLERRTKSPSILMRLFGRAPEAIPLSAHALCVAIASGKGGTGKSFLASNLAVGLHELGSKVTLVDCDFGLGNAHLLLGANPRVTIQHVLLGKVTIEEARLRSPYGPHLVPGGCGISSLSDLHEEHLVMLVKSLARLAISEDVLLLDAPAGIAPQSLWTMLAAQHIVLVTNPEIAAVTDAYALIKCLARHPKSAEVQVVVNRVREPGQGEATFAKLADVALRFSGARLHYLGAIPEEPAVLQRRLGQAPLLISHPKCEASRSIRGILDTLSKTTNGFRPREIPPEATLAQRMQRKMPRNGR